MEFFHAEAGEHVVGIGDEEIGVFKINQYADVDSDGEGKEESFAESLGGMDEAGEEKIAYDGT